MKSKILWRLKQVVPLTYWTTYGDEHSKRHFCVWRMWFGRCFNVTDFIIG